MNSENITIIGTVKTKVASYLANHSAGQIFKGVIELICGGILGALMINPDPIINWAVQGLQNSNYAIPKAGLVMAAFFYRRWIFRVFRAFRRTAKVQKAIKAEDKLIDNIPVPELVDYLMRNKKFTREGVNGVRATFGFSMDKFNALAKRLEENGVLVRGENNGRVLADNWSRQTLIDYLSGSKKSADLIPRFKIYRIGANAKVRLDRPEIPALN